MVATMDYSLKMMRKANCLEASSVRAVACDFCPAVHVDLLNREGECFATASIPREHFEPFIEQFRAAVAELQKRHSAPAKRQ